MQAVVRRRYGSPDVMTLEEVNPPAVAPDTVLVRVKASSVNAYDWHLLRGKPYIARDDGIRRPRDPAMGLDVAGIVEEVGADVADLRPGDRVYGTRNGAFAELVAGRNFVAMPAGLSFEEAAAVPVAGTTAIQAIRDRARVQPGHRVLVTGAGGGVGTFAVQIARACGGHVTAVTSAPKLDLVAAIGADVVIDGRSEDVTRRSERFDVVIDVAAQHPLRHLARLLVDDGTLVLVGPGRGDWAGPLLRVASAVVRSRLGGRTFKPFLSKNSRDDLLALKALIEAGRIRPVVDRVYPLSQAAEAVRRVERGDAAGKVIISVAG